MRQRIWSALVKIKACRLFGAKPLCKPVLGFYRLELFDSRKCIWKCLLPKWRPFCPGGNELKYVCPGGKILGLWGWRWIGDRSLKISHRLRINWRSVGDSYWWVCWWPQKGLSSLEDWLVATWRISANNTEQVLCVTTGNTGRITN